MYAVAALIIGLLAPFTLAAPTVETVLTPGGHRAGSKIYEIPAGASLAHVDDHVHILAADGTVLNKVQVTPTTVKSAVSPLETGWITYASWLNTGTSPISSFTTTWTVPAVPQTNHDQTVFLFNSIEPDSGDAILQPVLQFGPSAAGGGAFWSLATWYLVGDSTFHTTLVRTSAGATLDGIITLTSSSGSNFNYVSSFTNVAGTSLTVSNAAELVWATETLEAYGLVAKTDYPAGSTVFSDINLKLASGAVPTVSWSHVNDATDGLSTTINTSGATNALITITY
ncbi:hypothetical protein C8R45DRAFT_1042445 [Mycena sanguinolenta]|nr:hypothetical protein C8R45DRAFT_1042445 [Mycena sanguinolenta]